MTAMADNSGVTDELSTARKPKARDLNELVRYTMWSVFRVSDRSALEAARERTTRLGANASFRRGAFESTGLETAAVDVAWSTSEEPSEAEEDPPLPEILAQLTPPHREVLLLRYQDDMSYAEMALVVGCSVGTVRSRLHHARRRARELAEQGR